MISMILLHMRISDNKTLPFMCVHVSDVANPLLTCVVVVAALCVVFLSLSVVISHSPAWSVIHSLHFIHQLTYYGVSPLSTLCSVTA